MPIESTTSGSGASTITSTTAPDSAIDEAVDKPTTTPTGPNLGSIAETRKRLALDNQPTETTAGLAPATPGGSTPTVESRVDEIVRRIKGITGSGDEKRILAILSDADGVDLDTILARVDQHIGLHKLIDDIDDHRWPFGGKNQAALFTLLTEDRLADLSIATRAALVQGLQYHRTGSRDERAIRNIFIGTRGTELTELKNRVDAGGDHRDLQQLVFHDIDSSRLRREILAHIAEASPSPDPDLFKLLSDVDDTFYASLNDARYPKGTVYPGVVAFYRALAGNAGDRRTDLTFLTARPWDRPGAIEAYTKASLGDKGAPEHVVLSGDLVSLRDDQAMADKKLENFEQYRQLYPEYNFVFVGDSGQGDALLGAALQAQHGTAVPAVFIHDVNTPPIQNRQSYRDKGIFMFDTYVGAAAEALALGLVDADGLRSVIDAAASGLAKIELDNPEQKAAMDALFGRDIRAARELLAAQP